MKNKKKIKIAADLSRKYLVTDGAAFRLKDFDPGDTGDLKGEVEENAADILKAGIEILAELQDKLYAQDRWGVLLVIQAMDAAGKDGVIKHVMSGLNPQGCNVSSFKAPSVEELDHDYLWRCMKRIPERGNIGIFNRSYYEEVLVAKVHPEIIESQRIPDELKNKDIWEDRYNDIRHFEKYLVRNGIIIRKFFLYLSHKEQKKRFLARIDNPDKNWKFSISDAKERSYWKDYMNAYEEMIQNTATKDAPWYVVPADNKWFTRLVVAAAVIDALDSLDLVYPKVGEKKLEELEEAKKVLLAEK